MFRIIRVFFIGMGMTFTIILCALAYVVIADPFHIRPLIALFVHTAPISSPPVTTVSVDASTTESTIMATTTELKIKSKTAPAETAGGTADQRAALKSVGIDPDTAIKNFTPVQIECFVKILGESRVVEIKAGAVPSAAEFMSVRGCL